MHISNNINRMVSVMTAKQLLFFKRIAELENLTKAANDLMVSQPFLSRVLSELEAEIGVNLFDHVGRRIYLNSYGSAFYKRVVNIINDAEDAVEEVRDMYSSQASRLTIVTNVSLYMPGLLKMLSESNPDLIISQYSNRRSKIEKMITSGEVDFAICCPQLEQCENLESIVLRYEPGVLIYPSGHWLAHIDEVDVNDIKNETFISVSKGFGTRDIIDQYMQKENILPRISLETTDTSSVFKYVENGLGIAFVPFSQVLAEPRFINNYTKIKNKVGGEIVLSWRHGKYINEAGKSFIEKSKEYFKSLDNLR